MQPSPSHAYLPSVDNERVTKASVLRTVVRAPTIAGLSAVMVLVVAFAGWGLTAPLAGGAVAPGVISLDGSRKTVQHLEGGIVGEIMIRDGDLVRSGAPLITLEDTSARATYEMLLWHWQGLRALHARLTAERLGQASIYFPQDLVEASKQPEVAEILEMQRQLFATRAEAGALRRRVLQQRIRQVRDQIHGSQAQFASSLQRINFIEDELKSKEILLEKGLTTKPAVLALRRARAEITGDKGQYRAAIAQGEEKVGETSLEIMRLDAERSDEIAAELDKCRGELAKVNEQLRASKDTLNRTVVTAPVEGTVVNLRVKTRGGVLQPGEPILDIVPAKDELLIDARVAPTDIDVVHAGQLAQVHLTAFTNRGLPRIEGKVRSVSADSLRDEKTGMSYYLARVEVDRNAISKLLGDKAQLVPGMPAEVLIVTGERTLFGYLIEPLRDIFRRGLREM